MMSSVFAGAPETETNNEPIFQAELRTTLGKDTILARWYNADIHRNIHAGQGVDSAYVQYARVWGTGPDANGNVVSYNGRRIPLYFYNYYNQDEIDTLKGYSLELTHPFRRRTP